MGLTIGENKRYLTANGDVMPVMSMCQFSGFKTPVYWWSFPAQLKGWPDRVLNNTGAYGTNIAGTPTKKLAGFSVYLLPLAWRDVNPDRSWYFDGAVVA